MTNFAHLRTLPFDTQAVLARLRCWVECESPSYDADAVNRMAEIAAEEIAGLGAQVSRIPGRQGYGDCVRARLDAPGQDEGGILFIGHLDTVHPLRTLAQLPWRESEGRCYGPGILDMKGGIVIALEALAMLDCLSRGTSDLSRRYFPAAARPIRQAWQLAAGGDLALPEIEGARPFSTRLLNGYVDRVLPAGGEDAHKPILAPRLRHQQGTQPPIPDQIHGCCFKLARRRPTPSGAHFDEVLGAHDPLELGVAVVERAAEHGLRRLRQRFGQHRVRILGARLQQ